jgi:hypothetical protein
LPPRLTLKTVSFASSVLQLVRAAMSGRRSGDRKRPSSRLRWNFEVLVHSVRHMTAFALLSDHFADHEIRRSMIKV